MSKLSLAGLVIEMSRSPVADAIAARGDAKAAYPHF